MLINSHSNAEGQMQHCLVVPQMVVATSLMELQSHTCSVESKHDGGVLLGGQNFQAVLTLPMTDSLTGMLYLWYMPQLVAQYVNVRMFEYCHWRALCRCQACCCAVFELLLWRCPSTVTTALRE